MTLVDDFNDNTLNTAKWTQTNNPGVTGDEAGQAYQLAVTPTAVGYSNITSVNSFDLTGSHHSVELVDAGAQQSGLEAYVIVRADPSNRLLVVVANGFYGVYKVVGGVQTGISFGSYNPVDHRWLRIREADGVTYWEHSPDGTAWTALHSEPNPIPVTSTRLVLEAGAWQQLGETKTVIYDNVGGPPPLITLRPDTGSVARPSTGTVLRPSAGTVTRPATGIVTRP